MHGSKPIDTLLYWACQAALQICRRLPRRSIVLVADIAAAAIELLAAVHTLVCIVARLRLDAKFCAIRFRSCHGRAETLSRSCSHTWQRMENVLARAELTASAKIKGFQVTCPIRK